jgi:hypothetical protein
MKRLSYHHATRWSWNVESIRWYPRKQYQKKTPYRCPQRKACWPVLHSKCVSDWKLQFWLNGLRFIVSIRNNCMTEHEGIYNSYFKGFKAMRTLPEKFSETNRSNLGRDDNSSTPALPEHWHVTLWLKDDACEGIQFLSLATCWFADKKTRLKDDSFT